MLKDKIKIIQEVDENFNRKTNITLKYLNPKSTLPTIFKNRIKIITSKRDKSIKIVIEQELKWQNIHIGKGLVILIKMRYKQMYHYQEELSIIK